MRIHFLLLLALASLLSLAAAEPKIGGTAVVTSPSGKAAGTTIYWDGSTWVTNLIGSAGQVLTVGTNRPYYSTITSGVAGTVVNTGASTSGQVPTYSDTTGTNVAPTTVTGTGSIVKGTLPTISNINYSTATDTYAATVTLDFSAAYLQTISLTGDLILATSNLAAGRKIVVRLITDGTIRNLTFPGTWTFIGASAPVSQAASKTALLELTSFSTTDANVVAAYAVQP